jgi:hypothetical protein
MDPFCSHFPQSKCNEANKRIMASRVKEKKRKSSSFRRESDRRKEEEWE